MSENPTLESALLRAEARLDRILADVEKMRERMTHEIEKTREQIIVALTEVQETISRAEHQRWKDKLEDAKKAPAAEAGADGGELA